MKWSTWVFICMHGCIWGVALWAVFTYATIPRQVVFLNILASREESLALPVFAQFTATQKLTLDRPVLVSNLIVPLYVPEHSQPLKIRLYNQGRVVGSWVYSARTNQKGIIEASLPITVPILLESKVEVLFDGSAILYDDKDRAPRLFIESEDSIYPYGNYRIAGNEKQGDVSLKMVEEKQQYILWLERFHKDAQGFLWPLFPLFAAVLLILKLPSLLIQLCVSVFGKKL